MGWITPLGHDVEGVWQRLLGGHSGMAYTTLFDATTFPTKFAAEVKDFRLQDFLGESYGAHTDASRNTSFALAAAKLAWDGAGLSTASDLDPTQVGVYLGGGEGPLDFDNFVEAAVKGWDHQANSGQGGLDAVKWYQIAHRKLSPVRELEQDPNMAAGHLAVLFNAQGPNLNTLTACAASTQALGEATCIIRRGDADVMVSGGTHSMVHPFGATGFNRLTALSTRNEDCLKASRPFDRNRDGFVLGEGAGMVILEELEHARARGAQPLAEIAGYGSTADAFRITDIHEDGRGAIAAIRAALADAGLQPKDIDYISAHGTSTEENDKIESLAIRQVFCGEGRKVAISSIKSMMGHLIAAAGAVELITCVLSVRDGVVPPTINYENPDPNCDLDYVPNQARKMTVRHALSNSFGFGGQNDTLVISAVEG
ncbi:MAG: beta-ketoacyl-[acyl-carrier-protein] synthase family protein [Phycisphaerales bacterium]|nr:MAG: beta-ketoacyl-[acyl-carrier-protein] synthase family protein [Phycisphaerales bacterium]